MSDSLSGVLEIPVGVLAVRHGQTLWNATYRWQGWADIDLDDEGVRQAQVGASALAALIGQRPVRVVSSDLLRARRTAELLAGSLGVTVHESITDLRERNVGDWSGKTTPEIEATWPGMLGRWREGNLPMIPGGESEAALVARTTSVLERLCADAAQCESVIVAVTHGGVIRTLTAQVGGPVRPVGNLGATSFTRTATGVRYVGDVDLVASVAQRGTAL